MEVRDDQAPEPGSYFQGETPLRAVAERVGDFIIFQCPLRHTASFRCGAEVRKRLSGHTRTMPAISNHDALTTGCCIAGGGPAGMMLGFLLARAGVEVVVLEKHPDFLRDFRGDTIHPSTLEVIRELGLLDEFLKLPHEEARRLWA